MTQLYILADEYRQAADKLADMDLPDDVIADTLEALAGDFETKATNVALFSRNLAVMAAAMLLAEAGIAARRKAVEARIDRVNGFLLANMQATGIKTIDSAYLRLSVRDNPPAVDVFDAAQVPAQYMLQPDPPPPSVDKAAVKAAFKAGEDVPGCRITQSQRLEVKA